MTFQLKPNAIPESAWTERVSEVCCICGGSVGRDEHDDLRELHDPGCIGCPICEIAIRFFRELPDGRVLGVALHWNCFEGILEK